MRTRRCAGRSPACRRDAEAPGSVPEIAELQRAVELGAAQQRDRRLQVVALLAGDAHFVALDARLHLEPRVLDEPGELLAGLRIDTVAQRHLLARGGEVGLRLLHVETAQVDAALGEA